MTLTSVDSNRLRYLNYKYNNQRFPPRRVVAFSLVCLCSGIILAVTHFRKGDVQAQEPNLISKSKTSGLSVDKTAEEKSQSKEDPREALGQATRDAIRYRIALGKRLNRDFCAEGRLGAFIFSNYDAAKKFSPSEESPYHEESWKAFRASYDLDRNKKEEEIRFSTDAHTPQIRKTVAINNIAPTEPCRRSP